MLCGLGSGLGLPLLQQDDQIAGRAVPARYTVLAGFARARVTLGAVLDAPTAATAGEEEDRAFAPIRDAGDQLLPCFCNSVRSGVMVDSGPGRDLV